MTSENKKLLELVRECVILNMMTGVIFVIVAGAITDKLGFPPAVVVASGTAAGAYWLKLFIRTAQSVNN